MEREMERLEKFRQLMSMLVRKWTVEIMYCLYTRRSMRFTEIRKLLGMNSRTLSNRLLELEQMGLVKRIVDVGKPVRVSYELTSLGRVVGERAYEGFEKLIDAWEIANRDELYSALGPTGYRFIACSDLHKPEHIYSWKTLVYAEKNVESFKKAVKAGKTAIHFYDSRFDSNRIDV